MRVLLLALAILYAGLPPGLCPCRLQAMLFPPIKNAESDTGIPCDDEEEGPQHECHCAGAKQLCICADAPAYQDDSHVNALILEEFHPPLESIVTVCAAPSFCDDWSDQPLYLTLRAFLI
jgi:hypothetical protein